MASDDNNTNNDNSNSAMAIEHISEVPADALRSLAKVLAMPPSQLDGATEQPSEQWLAAQQEKLADLPACLLLPRGLKGLSMIISEKGKAIPSRMGLGPSPTLLCKAAAHVSLNPRLVRQFFFYLAREVADHADEIRQHGQHLRDDGKDEDPAVRDWGDRMLGVSALWSDAATFSDVCGQQYRHELRLPHMEHPCEACILAAIGARGQVLADLRAGMLSRTRMKEYAREKYEKKQAERKKRHRHEDDTHDRPKKHRKLRKPHLWAFLEAWIDLFGARGAADIRSQSEALASPLFEARKHEAKRIRREVRAYDKQLQEKRGWTAAELREAWKRGPPCLRAPRRTFTKQGYPMPLRRLEYPGEEMSVSPGGTERPLETRPDDAQHHDEEQHLVDGAEHYLYEDLAYHDSDASQAEELDAELRRWSGQVPSDNEDNDDNLFSKAPVSPLSPIAPPIAPEEDPRTLFACKSAVPVPLTFQRESSLSQPDGGARQGDTGNEGDAQGGGDAPPSSPSSYESVTVLTWVPKSQFDPAKAPRLAELPAELQTGNGGDGSSSLPLATPDSPSSIYSATDVPGTPKKPATAVADASTAPDGEYIPPRQGWDWDGIAPESPSARAAVRKEPSAAPPGADAAFNDSGIDLEVASTVLPDDSISCVAEQRVKMLEEQIRAQAQQQVQQHRSSSGKGSRSRHAERGPEKEKSGRPSRTTSSKRDQHHHHHHRHHGRSGSGSGSGSDENGNKHRSRRGSGSTNWESLIRRAQG